MFIILMSVLATSIMALFGTIATQNLMLRDQGAQQNMQTDIAIAGAAVEQYYRANNNYPASLSALAATPGYEYINRFANSPRVYGYRVATGISDGTNTFARAAVFQLNTKIGETSADYTSGTNTCGTGNFDTAESWCGAKASPWVRYESRTVFIAQIADHYQRIYKLFDKISVIYSPSKNPIYPAMDPTTDYLVNLVGYAGTAASCSGTFRLWGNIELDCGDLFSPWGTPVRVVRQADNYLTLGAAPP